eukprot:292046_1
MMKLKGIGNVEGNNTQSKLHSAIARVRVEQIANVDVKLELKEQELDVDNTTKLITKSDTETDRLFEMQTEEEIKETFKRIDLDGDGYATIDELVMLLTSLGYAHNFAQKEARNIMSEIDLDGDGTIDFNEFAEAWLKRKLCINDKYTHAIFNIFQLKNYKEYWCHQKQNVQIVILKTNK